MPWIRNLLIPRVLKIEEYFYAILLYYYFEDPTDIPWASLVAQLMKNLPEMQDTQVRSLGWGDPLRRKRQPTDTPDSTDIITDITDIPGSYSYLTIWTCRGTVRTNCTFNSLRPYGLYPTRLLCPWDSPDKNTRGGMSCPPPGDLPNAEMEPKSHVAPTLQAGSLPLSSRTNYHVPKIFARQPFIHFYTGNLRMPFHILIGVTTYHNSLGDLAYACRPISFHFQKCALI